MLPTRNMPTERLLSAMGALVFSQIESLERTLLSLDSALSLGNREDVLEVVGRLNSVATDMLLRTQRESVPDGSTIKMWQTARMRQRLGASSRSRVGAPAPLQRNLGRGYFERLMARVASISRKGILASYFKFWKERVPVVATPTLARKSPMQRESRFQSRNITVDPFIDEILALNAAAAAAIDDSDKYTRNTQKMQPQFGYRLDAGGSNEGQSSSLRFSRSTYRQNFDLQGSGVQRDLPLSTATDYSYEANPESHGGAFEGGGSESSTTSPRSNLDEKVNENDHYDFDRGSSPIPSIFFAANGQELVDLSGDAMESMWMTGSESMLVASSTPTQHLNHLRDPLGSGGKEYIDTGRLDLPSTRQPFSPTSFTVATALSPNRIVSPIFSAGSFATRAGIGGQNGLTFQASEFLSLTNKVPPGTYVRFNVEEMESGIELPP